MTTNSVSRNEIDMSRNLLETSPNAVLVLLYAALGFDYFNGRTSRISQFIASSFGVQEIVVLALIAIGFFSAALLIFWRSPHSQRNVVYAIPLMTYNLLTALALPLARVPVPSGSIITLLSSTMFFLLYDWQYQHRQMCETKCAALTQENEHLKSEVARMEANRAGTASE